MELLSQPCFTHLVKPPEEMRSEGLHFSRSAEKALAEGKPLTSIDYGMPPKFFQERSFYRRFAAFSTLGALATGAFSVYHFKALKAGGRISPQLLQAVAGAAIGLTAAALSSLAYSKLKRLNPLLLDAVSGVFVGFTAAAAFSLLTSSKRKCFSPQLLQTVAGAAIGLTAAALSSLAYSKFKYFWNDLDYREERASEQKWIEKIREGEFDNLPEADQEQINENHRDLMVFNSPEYKGENFPLVKEIEAFLRTKTITKNQLNDFIHLVDIFFSNNLSEDNFCSYLGEEVLEFIHLNKETFGDQLLPSIRCVIDKIFTADDQAAKELKEIGLEEELRQIMEIKLTEEFRLILDGKKPLPTLKEVRNSFFNKGILCKDSKFVFSNLIEICKESKSNCNTFLEFDIKTVFIKLFDDQLELFPDSEGAFSVRFPNEVIEELKPIGISQEDINICTSRYKYYLLDGPLKCFNKDIQLVLRNKKSYLALSSQKVKELEDKGYSEEKIQIQIHNYAINYKKDFFIQDFNKIPLSEVLLNKEKIEEVSYYVVRGVLQENNSNEVKEKINNLSFLNFFILNNENEDEVINIISFAFDCIFSPLIDLDKKFFILQELEEKRANLTQDLKNQLAKNLISNKNHFNEIGLSADMLEAFYNIYGSNSSQKEAGAKKFDQHEVRTLLRTYLESNSSQEEAGAKEFNRDNVLALLRTYLEARRALALVAMEGKGAEMQRS